MEVHHHPNLHHEKKPWKEYILEGLMIFFAVTMGFFAENIREGISDREKGKEYIRSFVQDLRTDTANISNLMAFDQNKMIALNNLVSCYDSIQRDSRSSSCLVPIVKSSMINRNMSFTDGTMEQLKNAGGFRMLNESDKDSIVAYDHAIRDYQDFESTVFQQRQNIVREVLVKLVSFKANAIINADTVNRDIKMPLFFSANKPLINEFFNDLLLYRRVNNTQISQIKARKEQAIRLIKYFEDKYDLE